MITLDQPLDLDDPGADAFLDRIQGNILKGHGRPLSAQVVLRFTSDPSAIRSSVAQMARHTLTSALQQRHSAQRRAQTGDGGPFAMLALSAAGYEALGIPESQ